MTKYIRYFYLGIVYTFFYLPILFLILYSFNNTHYSLHWYGFTWKWYTSLFHNRELWMVSLHSLTLASLAASSATFLGIIAAISLYRYHFQGKRLLHGLIFMLILLPDIVLGLTLLILFHMIQLPLGFISLLIAHITFCVPFTVMIIYNRLTYFDKDLFLAGSDLGASDRQVFFKIFVPLLWSAILAAFLLSFTLSFDDVIVSYFVAGPEFEILPLKIYSLIREGITPEINALCSIIFILMLILIVIAQFAMRKKT